MIADGARAFRYRLLASGLVPDEASLKLLEPVLGRHEKRLLETLRKGATRRFWRLVPFEMPRLDRNTWYMVSRCVEEVVGEKVPLAELLHSAQGTRESKE